MNSMNSLAPFFREFSSLQCEGSPGCPLVGFGTVLHYFTMRNASFWDIYQVLYSKNDILVELRNL